MRLPVRMELQCRHHRLSANIQLEVPQRSKSQVGPHGSGKIECAKQSTTSFLEIAITGSSCSNLIPKKSRPSEEGLLRAEGTPVDYSPPQSWRLHRCPTSS